VDCHENGCQPAGPPGNAHAAGAADHPVHREQESATLEDEEEQAQAEPEGQEESPVEPPQEGQPAEAKAEEAAAQPPEAADEVDDYDAEPVDEVTVEESGTAEQFERCDELEDYYAEFEDVGYTRRYSSEEPDEKREAFENSPAPEPTLEEHLGRQLAEQELDETVRRVCENIIANLDERGYLAYPLEEIVASMDMAVSPEQAEEALRVVQSFEPPGVGARSLEECLLLQLDPREPDYEFLRTLIREHFQDILQNRLPKVAQAMGCSLDELKAAVEKIGKLNPKPGSLFSSERPPYVVPDLRVEEVDGEFVVMLEDSWLPPLRISPFYQRKLRSGDLDPKGREYLRRKLQSAHGLISAIEHREPRNLGQVRPDPPGAFLPEALLHRRAAEGRRRGGVLGGRAPEAHRHSGARGQAQPAERPGDRRPAQGAGHRDRATHRLEVPQEPRHPLLPPAQALLSAQPLREPHPPWRPACR